MVVLYIRINHAESDSQEAKRKRKIFQNEKQCDRSNISNFTHSHKDNTKV